MDDHRKERRLSARLKGQFQIHITDEKKDLKCLSMDISLRGLQFRAATPMSLFHELSIKLALPFGDKTEELSFEAIVVRCEEGIAIDGYQIALLFVDMENHVRSKLQQFLEKYSSDRQFQEE